MTCYFNCLIETEGLLKVTGTVTYTAKWKYIENRATQRRRYYRPLIGIDNDLSNSSYFDEAE